jgi:hypothetical protein
MRNHLQSNANPLKKTLQLLTELGNQAAKDVYFFDEGRFGLQSSLCRAWARKGSSYTVKVKQGYKNFYIYSAVAPKTGDQYSLFLPYVNTEMMQLYLDELSMYAHDQKIILIMDQAGWHKSRELIVPGNIQIWFLPPYSPELNPIERLWKRIKQNTLHNRIFNNLKQLETAVLDYFDTLTEDVLSNLCACSYI